jgi:hypothetical protein
MAQLKKRTTVGKRKSTARGKARKASVAVRGKVAAKQGVAKASPRKGSAKSSPNALQRKRLSRRELGR